MNKYFSEFYKIWDEGGSSNDPDASQILACQYLKDKLINDPEFTVQNLHSCINILIELHR